METESAVIESRNPADIPGSFVKRTATATFKVSDAERSTASVLDGVTVLVSVSVNKYRTKSSISREMEPRAYFLIVNLFVESDRGLVGIRLDLGMGPIV